MSLLEQRLPHMWSIILTGRPDDSSHPRLQRLLKDQKPKPFCTFVGSRSMLQHTWDRADQITHPQCKITVVGTSFLHETCSQLGGRVPGTIITEPHHCGMIPSLYLALTYLRTKEQDSTVIAYPADHFIYPDERFVRTIQRAVWASERLRDHVIMVGVIPPGSSSKGGYIRPAHQLGWVSTSPIYGVREVAETSEPPKPSTMERTIAFSNTSVLVAKADLLWKLGWKSFEPIMTFFEEFQDAIGTSYEKTSLRRLFQLLQTHSLSLHTIFHESANLAVMELEGVTWSEWETPDQIVEDLATIGKRPLMSMKFSQKE